MRRLMETFSLAKPLSAVQKYFPESSTLAPTIFSFEPLAAIWNRGHCSESINLFSCPPFSPNVNIFNSFNGNSCSPYTTERLTRNRSCDTQGTWRSLPVHRLYGFHSGNPQQSTAALFIPIILNHFDIQLPTFSSLYLQPLSSVGPIKSE